MTDSIKSVVHYLFTPIPGQSFRFYIPIIILGGLLIVGSILFSLIYNRKKKYDFAFKRCFKKLSSTLLIFGILFLFLAVVRYETIPYFSIRALLYITSLVFLYFIYRCIKTAKITYPKEKETGELNRKIPQSGQNRYLPNK